MTTATAASGTSLLRLRLGARGVLLAVFALYVPAISIAALRHEPWFDEAQAWLLARDSNPVDLLTRYLPYEGSPGLWHLLLMLPSRLLSYRALNLISATLAVLGVWLLLRYSPFPLPVKLILPFTFFLFFQYGVVARNYALMPPLAYLTAMMYPERREKPFLYAALLLAFANVSAQGFFIAAGVMAANVLDLMAAWRHASTPLRWRNAAAVAAFGVLMGLLALIMRPPPDRIFALPENNEPAVDRIASTADNMLTGAFAESELILALAMLASLWFFWRRGTLMLYLLPTAAVILFSAFVYHSPWHEGTLFVVWLFVLWVSYESESRPGRPGGRERWSRTAVTLAILTVCVVQMAWTASAVRHDYNLPYSGSKALASYIKQHNLDQANLFATGFATVALLPYFETNIFANYHNRQKPAFWIWSKANDMIEDPRRIEEMQPDYVIMTIKAPGGESFMQLLPSYRQVAVFEGLLYWKTFALEPDYYILLERRTPGPPPNPRAPGRRS